MNNCNEKLKSIVTAINDYHNCNDIYICGELRDYVEEELGQMELDFTQGQKVELNGESIKLLIKVYDFVNSFKEKEQTNE